ncbi:hypothetical protein GLE_2402 [Lysobacter enzymogenes]|uniref:Uncharacterized protein n=1 Tax=Lysobacter enzymogenes TaxID=69 RepID=A0A0S2DGJ4_LYSEN|nr:hypothetical protein GLE_2402 [Lysobacter enzymogenes]
MPAPRGIRGSPAACVPHRRFDRFAQRTGSPHGLCPTPPPP